MDQQIQRGYLTGQCGGTALKAEWERMTTRTELLHFFAHDGDLCREFWNVCEVGDVKNAKIGIPWDGCVLFREGGCVQGSELKHCSRVRSLSALSSLFSFLSFLFFAGERLTLTLLCTFQLRSASAFDTVDLVSRKKERAGERV